MSRLDALLPALEIAANRLISTDPELLARLGKLSADPINIELTDLGWTLSLRPTRHGVQLAGAADDAVASVAATVVEFARAAAGGDPRQALGSWQLSGDAEQAEAILALLSDAQFDLEGEMSRLVGPEMAYHLGRGLRGLLAFGRQTTGRLLDGGVTVLRDDLGDLVAAPEVEGWMDEVDDLVARVDRLEARLAARLEPQGVQQPGMDES